MLLKVLDNMMEGMTAKVKRYFEAENVVYAT